MWHCLGMMEAIGFTAGGGSARFGADFLHEIFVSL
jgi:hypothetical protein